MIAIRKHYKKKITPILSKFVSKKEKLQITGYSNFIGGILNKVQKAPLLKIITLAKKSNDVYVTWSRLKKKNKGGILISVPGKLHTFMPYSKIKIFNSLKKKKTRKVVRWDFNKLKSTRNKIVPTYMKSHQIVIKNLSKRGVGRHITSFKSRKLFEFLAIKNLLNKYKKRNLDF